MTRHCSRWPVALALMIAAAPAAFAQAPGMNPNMNPGMPPPPPPPPAAPPPTIVPTTPGPVGVAALVNGHKIYRYQVANEALSLNGAGAKILNIMVLIEIINQEAVKRHVVVTPAQADAQLATIQQQATAQVPGGLSAVLAQRHQSLASFREQLITQMKVEALVVKTLPAAVPPVLYHARHLLIAVGPPPPESAPGVRPVHTDAEALAIIAKAQAEIKGGKSFEDVANEYTEDPSGKGKGGDLGIIDANTRFDPAFLKAALALKAGEVTPMPVKSQFGYHLIKIDSTGASPLASDKALYQAAAPAAASRAAAARHQQIETAIPGYLQALRRGAKVVDYLGQ